MTRRDGARPTLLRTLLPPCISPQSWGKGEPWSYALMELLSGKRQYPTVSSMALNQARRFDDDVRGATFFLLQ